MASNSSSKLDSAKAEKNSAQASLYQVIAGILSLIALGAIVYFLGGWVLRLAYNILTFVTFVIGAVAVLVGLFQTRNGVRKLTEKYATNWEFYHSILGEGKPIEEFTPEAKEKLRAGAFGWALMLSFAQGAIWLLPVLTGLNSKFQVMPLNYMALPAIVIGIWLTCDGLWKHINRLDKKNFDAPLNKVWRLKSYLGSKIGYLFLALYFLGIVLVVFGVL